MSEIYYLSGSCKQSELEQSVRIFSGKPSLLWLEPRPSFAQGKNSVMGLIKPENNLIPDHNAEEFRLFWVDAIFHAVRTEEEGWKWFACSEKQFPGGGKKQVIKKKSQVHTRQDLERFGLTKDNLGNLDKLQLVEYWDGKRLFAWRLNV